MPRRTLGDIRWGRVAYVRVCWIDAAECGRARVAKPLLQLMAYTAHCTGWKARCDFGAVTAVPWTREEVMMAALVVRAAGWGSALPLPILTRREEAGRPALKGTQLRWAAGESANLSKLLAKAPGCAGRARLGLEGPARASLRVRHRARPGGSRFDVRSLGICMVGY